MPATAPACAACLGERASPVTGLACARCHATGTDPDPLAPAGVTPAGDGGTLLAPLLAAHGFGRHRELLAAAATLDGYQMPVPLDADTPYGAALAAVGHYQRGAAELDQQAGRLAGEAHRLRARAAGLQARAMLARGAERAALAAAAAQCRAEAAAHARAAETVRQVAGRIRELAGLLHELLLAHADGAEYHGCGADADETAFRAG